jgi:hypothetical protein
VSKAAKPVGPLALDGSRVAYASGNQIRVWNVATGWTSVVKGRYAGRSSSAFATASQIAIAGAGGLAYAINPRYNGPGEVAFVPTAKLLALVG